MQALPAQMILHDGTVSSVDTSTLIPIGFNGRLMSRGHTVSIVELGKQLLKAAREGDTDQVRDLMGKGAPFTADWLGTSPLHFASLHNHLETCEVLLRAGISRDSRTKVDRTPLHMASYNGHIEIVQVLLSNGADIDARDMLKMTPLHWAVQNGHADVVTLLLRHGANSETVNKFDKTSIDIAIETSRIDILQLLQVITKDPSVCDPSEQIENIVSYADPMGLELDQEDQEQAEESVAKPEFTMEEDIQETNGKLEQSFEEQQINEHSSNIDLSDSMQMLKDHGISFLPADNSSVVASAVENGHSLVLTEVGKQVLNSTKPLVKVPVNKGQMTKLKGRKIITVTADQLLAMASSSKTVFKKLPIASPITEAPVKRIVMKKSKYSLYGHPNVIRRVKPEPPMHPDFECVTRQLQEARREAEEYKKMLKRKEEEAERYKKQLLSMSNYK